MSRRKGGVFDPDYRTSGWQESRYAPKNSATSMTQLALIIACVPALFLYFGLPALVPDTKPFLAQSMHGILTIGGISLAIFVFAGVSIRRREYNYLRRKLGLQTKQELNTPEIKERRKNARTRSLAAQKFEQDVAKAMQHLLPKCIVRVVGGSGDGGIDIRITQNEKLVGIVQCKQYDESKALPPAYIRELAAVKQRHQVKNAYLVTTARFSQASRAEAKEHGVTLIHGAQLKELNRRAEEKVYGQAIV